MNDAIVLALIGIMAAPLASLITWIVNRKKNIADIYSVFTESSQRAVETMQSAMETLHEELESAQEKIENLIAENQKMQQEIIKLREQNAILVKENHALNLKVDDLMKAFTNTAENSVISLDESSQHDN